MPKKTKDKEPVSKQCCYQVSAVITVDARGQTVLPKDLRDLLGIKPGDKLAVVVHAGDGKACCLSLMKVGELSKMVSAPLALVLSDGDAQ